MKKLLIFLLSIIFLTHHVFSQPDLQWLIVNSHGKVGTNEAGNENYYRNDLSNLKQFNIDSIALPDTQKVRKARNDIFVIYTNEGHFNTRPDNRNTNSPGFFYNAMDFKAEIVDHNFEFDPGDLPQSIGYLYLTNAYEGDDLPTGVKVNPGHISNTSEEVYKLSNTIPNTVLTANQDLVPYRDITVIVNYDRLRLSSKDSSHLFLTFNHVEPIGNGNPIRVDIIDLQPVFEYNRIPDPAFPERAYLPTDSPDSIQLNPHLGSYGYFNFRLNQKYFEEYGPDENGEPTHNVLFTFMQSGEVVEILKEPIRASHDPNCLRVDSICNPENGVYRVFYHLEFENISDQETDGLKAVVTFPDGFDLRFLRVTKWFAGGEDRGGEFEDDRQTGTFLFHNPRSLTQCHGVYADICKGYIDFHVKYQTNVDLKDPSNSLKLINPTVYFGNLSFPLNGFQDWMKIDKKAPHWFRPVKDGDCVYGQPRPNWIYFIGAIIAAIVAALLFARRRRRA